MTISAESSSIHGESQDSPTPSPSPIVTSRKRLFRLVTIAVWLSMIACGSVPIVLPTTPATESEHATEEPASVEELTGAQACEPPTDVQLIYALEDDLLLYGGDTAGSLELSGGGLIFDPVSSPDGKQIAFVRGGALSVIDSDGKNGRTFDVTPNTPIVWSPGGNFVAASAMKDGLWTLYSADIRDGDAAAEALVSDTVTNGISWAWSPIEDRLVYAKLEDPSAASAASLDQVFDIYVVDGDGTNPVLIGKANGPAPGLDWTPDGQAIIYHDWETWETTSLNIVDIETLSVIQQISGSGNPYGSYATAKYGWSPDGHLLEYQTGGNLTVLDVTTQEQVFATDNSEPQYYFYGWPNNQQMLYGIWTPIEDALDELLPAEGDGFYSVNMATGTQTRLTHHTPIDIRISPDGNYIAFGGSYQNLEDTSVSIVRADGSDLTQLAARANASIFDWSPDGRYLAYRGDHQSAYLFDTETSQSCLLMSTAFFDWRKFPSAAE